MAPPQVFSNYKITNTINDMLYIGATSLPPAIRWSQHKSSAKEGVSHPLYDAMREHGIDHFVFEVIKQHKGENGREAMLTNESILIHSLNTLVPNGYNRNVRRQKTRKVVRLDEWYTNEEAVERLSKNSGRPIDRNYPRTLARYRKVKSLDISNHNKLYFKTDIDKYVVGTTRGRKPSLDDDTVKREAIRKDGSF